MRTAARILEESPRLRQSVENGDSTDSWVDNEFFCLIYKLFFADIVTEFLVSVVASQITTAMPALLVADPTGMLTNAIAGEIASYVPTPCDEADEAADRSFIAGVGERLVDDALDRTIDSLLEGAS